MAASTINTECKRYGCMKNLLACFANCRYPIRCDDLRNELVDKTAQAESDINQYLTERGRKPILVQILKRGVKFDDPTSRQSRKTIRMASLLTIDAKPRVKLDLSAKPATKAPVPSVKAAGSSAKEKKRKVAKARKLAAPVAAVKDAVVKDKAVRKRLAPRPLKRSAKPQTRRQSKDRQTVALPITAALAPPRTANLRVPSTILRKPGKARLRKRTKTPDNAKLEKSKTFKNENSIVLEKPKMNRNETPATLSLESSTTANRSDITTSSSGKPAGTRKKSSAKPRNGKGNGKGNSKVYIIIEGQTATIVDEKGLMAHLFSSNAKNVRYFEASEVEARVQIIAKR